jgi:N-acetylmuramoyl-L-alanine amidase
MPGDASQAEPKSLERIAVRAAGLVPLLSFAIFISSACAAERTGAASAPAAAFPVVGDIRLGGDESQSRMVLDLSEKVDVRAFTLADPYRVVVDMPQVIFQLRPGAGEKGRGLIKAFRFGVVMPGGSRIVIDLTRPARIEKAAIVEAANDQPARLVLDLTGTDRESFLRLAASEVRTTSAPKLEWQPENKQADPRPLIVIDPGHGGIDNGTRAATGEPEKTIVLEFGLMLRDKIEKLGKYRVAMTRTEDNFVPLADRVALARAREAALFISIHADALARGEGDAQGAAIYTLSDRPSDARAARLAENENRADVIAGLDLSSEPKDVAGILIDLARRETKTFSVQFAQALVNALKPSTRLHQHPLKSASFVVLKAPDVPSVLIELGFVSNKSDLKSLISQEWRERTADSIVQGIEGYFTTRLAVSGQN